MKETWKCKCKNCNIDYEIKHLWKSWWSIAKYRLRLNRQKIKCPKCGDEYEQELIEEIENET